MIQPGTLLADRYRVLRVLGEGGMGIVVEAQNTATQRHVALKWLHPHIANNREASERLVREATAVCRIRHPNVVDVYDVVRDGNSLFLVMELLEGETFREVLVRGGLPIPELLALLIPAMRGVAEAHRCGVVHRDIHPANIFLTQSAKGGPAFAKILDFGISKIGDEVSGHPPLTRSGMTMGNPAYMSLEQLYTPRDVDARTDVYSFGVVLYEAITGRLPFEGETFAEIAVKIVSGCPTPPRQIRTDLPSSLERLVLRAMASKREERIASMDELADELERFASEQAFRAQMTEPNRPVPRAVSGPISASAQANSTPAPTPLAESTPSGLVPLALPTPPSGNTPSPSPVAPPESLTSPQGAPWVSAPALPAAAPLAQGAEAPRSGSPAPSLPPERTKATTGLLGASLGVLAVAACLSLFIWGREDATRGHSPAAPPPPALPATVAPEPTPPAPTSGTVESTLKLNPETAPSESGPKEPQAQPPAAPAAPATETAPIKVVPRSPAPGGRPAPRPAPATPSARKDPRAGRMKLDQFF